MSTEDSVPFDKWECQRVQLPDVNLFFRYHGAGPPLLLLHGCPQHSLMWHTIGPILAKSYTVIAPDLPGMGQSTIPVSRNYTAPNTAESLIGLMSFLSIEKIFVFSYDKGCGAGIALANKAPELVAKLVVAEYGLPGFGHEWIQNPEHNRTLYHHWHLALFSLPEAAEFLIRGREKEFLGWYFWHYSYSGNASISTDHLERYARELSKPGFLMAMVSYFGAIWDEIEYFKPLAETPLKTPMLAMAGEASMMPKEFVQQVWGPIGKDVESVVIPKAGHWIGDENPGWTARYVDTWFGSGSGDVKSVSLDWLHDKVTLV